MTAASTLSNCFSLAGTMPDHPDAIEVCDETELEDCADVNILPVGPNNPNKMVCQDLTLPFNAIFPEDNILYKLQWTHLGNFDVKELIVSDTLPTEFTFTVGSVVYSTNIQTLINAYKLNNPSFEPFSTALTMDGRTILKWDFTGLSSLRIESSPFSWLSPLWQRSSWLSACDVAGPLCSGSRSSWGSASLSKQ
jgi:uncharacterized repeat protein (TIGR01451 family)